MVGDLCIDGHNGWFFLCIVRVRVVRWRWGWEVMRYDMIHSMYYEYPIFNLRFMKGNRRM
jgi:hypothetical protein